MCVFVCVCVCVYVCVCIKCVVEQKDLLKKGKLPLKHTLKNKIQTICMKKKGANDLYVTWVTMSEIQKSLVHQSLCHVAMKKIKVIAKQVKKCKIKIGKQINDNKSVYLREDLAYKLVRYINLGVIEANEFRKNLGVKNDQSIRIEISIIAKLMKIFPKETMIKQCKIDGLPSKVDLYFVAHKFVIEIDGDGHIYYRNDQIRQKLIRNRAFTFVRINPDPDPDSVFDPDVEITKIFNYINKSSVRLAINLTGKSLKEKFPKELLSYMLSFYGPLKYVKYFIKKYYLPYKK